jgi:hypothetical protein
LGSAHTASSGRRIMDSMLRAGLDIGKDVVRGDVQTRLFGGVEEAVSRLVRFSDVAMIMCVQGRRRATVSSSVKRTEKQYGAALEQGA